MDIEKAKQQILENPGTVVIGKRSLCWAANGTEVRLSPTNQKKELPEPLRILREFALEQRDKEVE